MELILGWWNTSLTPTRGHKSSDKSRLSAIIIIKEMLDHGVDFLGLCEMSKIDIVALEQSLEKSGFGVMSAQDVVGRSHFDMAIVYRLTKVKCNVLPSNTVKFGRNNFRTSYNVTIEVDSDIIYLSLSHWPSRIIYADADKYRDYLANDLRKYVDPLLNDGSNLILMGDYNDEPFSRNIHFTLRAIRDWHLVYKSSDLLYNPFWVLSGGRPKYKPGMAHLPVAGSHYYEADWMGSWWLFDQILFSPSFVGRGSWHLIEDSVQFYESEESLRLLVDAKTKFDHLPVISAVFKENTSDELY